MKNSIIKKIVNGLKITTASVLIVLELALAGLGIYTKAKFSDYADDNKIEDKAEDLDCDLGYLNKMGNHYTVMEHNNREPIYVCLDESLNDKEKQDIIKALDNIFGIVGKVNSHYRYEIVSPVEYAAKIGKSKIYINVGSHSTYYEGQEFRSEGSILSVPNLISCLTEKRTRNNFFINLDREEIAKSDNENKIYCTVLHELMHAFGFDDVYTLKRNKTTDKHQGNTFMNTSLDDIGMMTPNDVRCLVALYSDNKTDNAEIDKFLNEYTENYYKNYTKGILEKCKKQDEFDAQDFEMEGSIRVTKEDGSKYGYLYQVDVENGRYRFNILDYYTNVILDSCAGEVVFVNGVAVLKDIDLKVGMRPYDETSSYDGGFVQDLVVGYLADYGKGVVLYDVQTNWGINCGLTVLEKSMEQ